MLPNFIIIGAQKSGTSFIHECLIEHPESYMPFGEISYFENPDYNQTSLEQFEQLFENKNNTQG